jgi:DMSO reductase anchor subunit
VILLTTLIGAGQGLFLAIFALGAPAAFVAAGCAISVLLLAAGLVASVFHLGRPSRGWRAASQWRTSWLSREVIVLPAFTVAVAAYGFTGKDWIGMLAVVLCLALFVCTGMIYACLKFLQEWHSPLTLINYLLLGLASGCLLAVVLAAVLLPASAPGLAHAALLLGAAGWVSRCVSLWRNARLRATSSTASATGVKHKRVVQISQGFTGLSFNTLEFFHRRPALLVRAVRWLFLLLIFPVPGGLLAFGGGTLDVYFAAFLLQFAGLLAERWYFFAEAKHPQNLYYQAMA